MKDGVIEYHIEVDGSEVTIMLIAEDAETANRLADRLTKRFKQDGLLNDEDEPDE
jgi:hypothetical protein